MNVVRLDKIDFTPHRKFHHNNANVLQGQTKIANKIKVQLQF